MKQIIFFLLFITMITTSSCSDFLNTPLKGDYTSENYYTNQEACEMAVNGVYNGLYDVLQWQWTFGDVASDDAVKGGNAGDQADILFINDFTAKSDNGIIALYWQYVYEVIARANNVIAFVPKVDINTTLRARYIGEAKFLRAYAYFQLVNTFGAVPLKVDPQTTEDKIHVPLSDINTIYSRIESDLSEAAADLPASYQSGDAGRVTKGAALAMLAKVNVFRKEYATAVSNIATLKTLSDYDLEPNYADLFKTGAENSKESLFAILFSTDSKVIKGNMLNTWFSPSIESGYYFNAPTQDYVNCFTENTETNQVDPRLDSSIGRDGMPWFNNSVFLSEWSETGYLVKKYNEDLSNTNGNKSLSTIPYHYIRYADVLLLEAEALNEIGGAENIEKARICLNKVRTRASLSEIASGVSQSVLKERIRAERRKELAFEFHRFFDLMRYGKVTAESALNKDGVIFTWGSGDNRTFYFPIPQAEIDSNKELH